MSPSFLEAGVLRALAVRLQANARPPVWRRASAEAAARVRPEALILSPEAAGLRAAWALSRAAHAGGFRALRWSDTARHTVRPGSAPGWMPTEVRELARGGGLAHAALRAMGPRPTAPGLVLFLSAGWPSEAVHGLRAAPAVIKRARAWRSCIVVVNAVAIPLAPKPGRPVRLFVEPR